MSDPLGEAIEDQRKIFRQGSRCELLLRVSLDRFLHGSQFSDARLNAGDGRFNLCPGLVCQGVSVAERGAYVNEFVRKDGGIRESNLSNCLKEQDAVGIEEDELLPI